MAVQLKGQSSWDAKAQAAREAQTADLYERYKRRPDDVVRFARTPGRTATIDGHPLYVGTDGSITCSAGGKLRAIRPENIEVKLRGPRGGVVWAPLIPEEG